ncbi:hypothetical protein JQN63_11435 [Delftia lacustris]|uniref:hypothetical protein n=1 Tax=Delftia lacustris TaxID=558537 RepID=UPI00193C612A|nr:hypothetical protein [Delftia lacustris]QRI92524.1 hypothetical protein JQN63_11435 [Delftia lacustris]
METAEQRQTPNSLVFGRHLGAMALASLMNPLIYYSDHPFTRWVETWATPWLSPPPATLHMRYFSRGGQRKLGREASLSLPGFSCC